MPVWALQYNTVGNWLRWFNTWSGDATFAFYFVNMFVDKLQRSVLAIR